MSLDDEFSGDRCSLSWSDRARCKIKRGRFSRGVYSLLPGARRAGVGMERHPPMLRSLYGYNLDKIPLKLHCFYYVFSLSLSVSWFVFYDVIILLAGPSIMACELGSPWSFITFISLGSTSKWQSRRNTKYYDLNYSIRFWNVCQRSRMFDFIVRS